MDGDGSNLNGEQENRDHVIAMGEMIRENGKISLEEKMKENPRILSQTAGNSSCCIFRVPQSLVEINEKAYQPRIVSIGPYHHGKQHLRMIEEHKGVYLHAFIARSEAEHGVVLQDLLEIIEAEEGTVRACYSEIIELETRELVDMMVLDGCFIIELFCRVTKSVSPVPDDDPIISMAWVFPFLMRDLLRLENQVPFFVLQSLYEKAMPSAPRNERLLSLDKLALKFFNFIVRRPGVVENFENLEAKHLLDLFHSSFMPASPRQVRSPTEIISSLQLIQSAKKLEVAGIEFKAMEEDNYLDIKFCNGKLQMPLLRMDDFSTSVFLNSVAFEQCYSHCSKHNTSYAIFMGCLINTPSDVGFLSDHKIIENYLGTDEEVVRFFNDIRKDVAFDIQNCYLSDVLEDVNEHYRNNWRVQLAGLKHTYFETPWSFMSALAALILLILTMIQAFFAVYGYIRPATPG